MLSFSAALQQLEAEEPPGKMQSLEAQAESAGKNKVASAMSLCNAYSKYYKNAPITVDLILMTACDFRDLSKSTIYL